MHKSVVKYANALGRTPGHIRRLIRANGIPSAELIRGRTGRPYWVIKDTSFVAIERLRRQINNLRHDRPRFCEAVPVKIFTETTDGKLTHTKTEIRWREVYSPQQSDELSILFEVVERIALTRHTLTPSDLSNPPVYYPDRWRCMVVPSHQRKVEAYDRTLSRLLLALTKHPRSLARTWALRVVNVSLKEADLTHAADQLAIYH